LQPISERVEVNSTSAGCVLRIDADLQKELIQLPENLKPVTWHSRAALAGLPLVPAGEQ
jgi:hypothetical protein